MFRQGSPFGFSGGPFGFAPARRQGLLAKVGSFNSPTAPGVQQITGIGFRPKLFLPFTVFQTVNGGASGMSISAGADDGTRRVAIGTRAGNGLTTTSVNRHQTSDYSISHRVSSAGNPDLEALVESFSDDGLSLTWSRHDGSARIVNGIWLGGGVECRVTQCQMNTALSTDSFAHGLSGPPDAIIFYTAGSGTAPPSFETNGHFGVGVWTPDSQWCASIYGADGLATPSVVAAARRLETDGVVEWTTTSNRRRMAVTSVDATEVHINYPITNSATNAYFWMVAIRGCKATSGYVNLAGSLAPYPIACDGIDPRLFFGSVITSGTGLNVATQMSLFASDEASCRSVAVNNANNVSTTDTDRRQDNSEIAENAVTGGLAFSAQTSFADQSVIVDPTTYLNSFYGKFGYLILGNQAA